MSLRHLLGRAGLPTAVALGAVAVAACAPPAEVDRRATGPVEAVARVDLDLGYLVPIDDRFLTIVFEHGFGKRDHLVALTEDGSVHDDVVPSALECPEQALPETRLLAPAGADGVAVVFQCPDPLQGGIELVISRDGRERTFAVPLPDYPSELSWDAERDEAWISYDDRICATVAVMDREGRFRRPSLELDGDPVPVGRLWSDCQDSSANVGSPAISPDGRFVALSINLDAVGHGGFERLSRPRELVVYRLADLSVVRRYRWKEDFGATWSPDSRSLVSSAITGTGEGMWLLRPLEDGRRRLILPERTEVAFSADGATLFDLAYLGAEVGEPADATILQQRPFTPSG